MIEDDADYKPGDVVTWMLPGNLHHICVISGGTVSGIGRPKVSHNIGQGAYEEDLPHAFKIIRHCRW